MMIINNAIAGNAMEKKQRRITKALLAELDSVISEKA
jgi:hypothetical protein